MNTRFIQCIDCGCDIEIGPLQQGTLRCEECRIERQRFLACESQKKRQIRAKRPAKGKKCHCGCKRPVGKGLTLLSKYCFKAYGGSFSGHESEYIYDDYRSGQGGCRLTEPKRRAK